MLEVHPKAVATIQSVIDVDHADESTVIEDVPEWDSLAGINILLALEEAFDVELPVERFFEAKTIGNIITIIEELAWTSS